MEVLTHILAVEPFDLCVIDHDWKLSVKACNYLSGS